MRVRAVVPGAAAACAALLAGCGGGEEVVRTVTVTAPERAAAPEGTTTAPRPPRPSGRTTGRTGTSTTRSPTPRPQPPVRTAEAPPTTTERRDPEPQGTTVVGADPIGGTTLVTGRTSGTGYSVRVPPGWNDGAKRFEGSGVDFDLTYVKGRGSGVSSNILIVRTAGRDVRGRTIDELKPTVRREIEAAAGGADVDAGPRIRVDGERAVTFRVRRRVGDTAVVQRQVAVVRDDALFTIGLNAVRATSGEDERVFAAFLRSWRWR